MTEKKDTHSGSWPEIQVCRYRGGKNWWSEPVGSLTENEAVETQRYVPAQQHSGDDQQVGVEAVPEYSITRCKVHRRKLEMRPMTMRSARSVAPASRSRTSST